MVKSGWTPTMEQRADLEGRQVKCLIASEGHLWMRGYFDRLADSRFNICPACMDGEARRVASRPTASIYCAAIDLIEQKLAQEK